MRLCTLILLFMAIIILIACVDGMYDCDCGEVLDPGGPGTDEPKEEPKQPPTNPPSSGGDYNGGGSDDDIDIPSGGGTTTIPEPGDSPGGGTTIVIPEPTDTFPNAVQFNGIWITPSPVEVSVLIESWECKWSTNIGVIVGIWNDFNHNFATTNDPTITYDAPYQIDVYEATLDWHELVWNGTDWEESDVVVPYSNPYYWGQVSYWTITYQDWDLNYPYDGITILWECLMSDFIFANAPGTKQDIVDSNGELVTSPSLDIIREYPTNLSSTFANSTWYQTY